MNTDSLPLPLEIRSVVKHFRAGSTLIHALNGVNLAVAAGEFVAIMGASGSGKSTLLHAMAGLTDVDSGQVRVDGQDLAELSDARLTRFRRRRIGLVFQAFNLIPSLTAEDNVRLPAEAGAGLDARIAGPAGTEGAPRTQAGRAVGRRAAAGGDRPRAGRRSGHPAGR